MKSQGLPMQTIVLIILVIVTLAAVLIFFFSSFGQGKTGVGEQNIFAKCQALCAKITSQEPTTTTAASNAANNVGFCDSNCDSYLSCKVESVSPACLITCSGGSASCT